MSFNAHGTLLRPLTLACLAVVGLTTAPAPPAAAHQSPPQFRSVVHGIEPAVAGLTVSVVDSDELRLVNETAKAVTIRSAGHPPKVVAPGAAHVWHEPGMQWTGSGVPPAVKDEGQQTKLFDYAVPLAVGADEAAIRGTLYWEGTRQQGNPILWFALLGLAGIGATIWLGRRQRAAEQSD